MVIAYWIIAGLLAIIYLYSGGSKLLIRRAKLQQSMQWVEQTPMWFVRTVGVLEVLGILGLVLPPLTGIATWLPIAAAAGLLFVQVGAIIVHVRRGERRQIGINLGLLVAAAVEIWLASIWL